MKPIGDILHCMPKGGQKVFKSARFFFFKSEEKNLAACEKKHIFQKGQISWCIAIIMSKPCDAVDPLCPSGIGPTPQCCVLSNLPLLVLKVAGQDNLKV